MVFAVVLVTALAATLSGCAPMGYAGDGDKPPTPRFAAPCQADHQCSQFASCAVEDFASCSDFPGIRGLRQQHTGTVGELDFRAQAVWTANEAPVSLWHDVPLIVSETSETFIVNAFFEISRGTQAKLELNKWERYNPIWQDRRSVSGQAFERPRYYAWSPAPGDYGALPRTWENVLEPDPITGYPGDTDPLDVISVGSVSAPLGIVSPVRVIGAIGMVDGTDRQTDWKIVVIPVDDPEAERIDEISDVPRRIRDQWSAFWRFYKMPTGHAENFFYAPSDLSGFSKNAVWLDSGLARQVITNSAKAYRQMIDQCLNLEVVEPYWVPDCPG